MSGQDHERNGSSKNMSREEEVRNVAKGKKTRFKKKSSDFSGAQFKTIAKMMKWELRGPPAMEWRQRRSEKRKQQERGEKLKKFAMKSNMK